MAIYRITPDDRFCWAKPVDARLYKVIYNLPWPAADGWMEHLFYRWCEITRLEGDLLWFGQGGIVVTEHARQILHDCAGESLEFLPIAIEDERLWLARAESIPDVLDMERSDVVRIPPGMRPVIFKKHAFVEGVHGPCVFRVAEDGSSPIFVQEQIVRSVKEAGLRGVNFEKI